MGDTEGSPVNVKVYSTEGCPFCEKAKSFLKE
ncbi:MAG: glutathione peroxidase, partial [Syntrophobacteraceae bacterium]|nr:glutathione peroxidase [Syntrophobacteraceae bacterium]